MKKDVDILKCVQMTAKLVKGLGGKCHIISKLLDKVEEYFKEQ